MFNLFMSCVSVYWEPRAFQALGLGIVDQGLGFRLSRYLMGCMLRL